MSKITTLSIALAAFMSAGMASAQKQDTTVFSLPEVQVLGDKTNKLFKNVPGSVVTINRIDLRNAAPLSTSDVLRKSTGLNVVDEDGAGLRTNIGIRGLNPIRSSKVLVLEDGIPVTLNPYGEPQLYYSPMIDKMDGVEVLKGSGQLEFGPQTIGGVVNFITARPPKDAETRVKLSAGRGGFFSGNVSHGNTIGNAGYFFNLNHKRADQLGPLGFSLIDFSGKLHFQLNSKSDLGIKFGVYDENSNSTYLGITQNMYDNNTNLRTTLTPDDLMLVRKVNGSIVHNYRINANVELQTNAYAYTIRRDWRRQQFTRNGANATSNGVVWGNTSLTDGGAIFMSKRTDWRNRQYQVLGLESKLVIKHQLFNVQNRLKTGVRVLNEKVDEQFVQGNKPDSWGGNMRDNEVRSGTGLSAFVINNTQITGKLSAEYGFRLENYGYDRRIYRGRFTVNGVNNVVADTNVVFDRNTFAFLPGAGLNYNVSDNLGFFGGVHKGFAPPVVKSAILPTGSAQEIDKEESTNWELGVRYFSGDVISLSATFFHMNFQNQVIPVTLATNATGTANGGETKHTGIEADLNVDIAKALKSGHSLIVGSNFTYTNSQFSGKSEVIDNVLPYSPKLVFNNYINLDLKNGFHANLSGNYVGEQFNDNLNTVTPSADGTIGRIDARYIIDAGVGYTVKKIGTTFNISAKNLTDKKYITSRNPQGIRLGIDRFITFGVDIKI